MLSYEVENINTKKEFLLNTKRYVSLEEGVLHVWAILSKNEM